MSAVKKVDFQLAMSLLCYINFHGWQVLPSSESVFSLMPEALHEANNRVAIITTGMNEAGPALKRTKKIYCSYSTEDPARIGRFAAEHRPTKESQHFTVQDSTAHLLKKQ